MARRYNSPGTDYDTSDANIVTGIGTGDFTWCTWIRVEASVSGVHAVAGNGSRAHALYAYTGTPSNPSKWGIYIGGAMKVFDSVIPENAASPAWTHICVTRVGTTITGYFNGLAEASTYTAGAAWADNRMTVGAADTTGLDGLPGQTHVAEHAAWDRALSAEEIAALASGFAPSWNPRGLVVYTPLYRGDNVQDYVGGGTWTENGTVGTRPGPRIVRPLPRLDFSVTEAITKIFSTTGGSFPPALQPHINTLENASPFAWLFEVEVPTSPPTRFRFCNQDSPVNFGVNSDGDPIVYDPLQIRVGNWAQGKSGDLPELTVTVSNIRGDVGAVLEAHGGLNNAPVIVRIVNLATLLDQNAQIRFDGNVRSVSVTNRVATFVIANYNLYQETVPAHRFMRNNCASLFGGPRCGYIIPESPTGVVGGGFSTCAKHLDACTERGADEVARAVAQLHPARFGAFRGLVRLSSKVPLV